MAHPELTQQVLDGEVPASYIAHLSGFTSGAVARALQAVRITQNFEAKKADWVAPWVARATIPTVMFKRFEVMSEDDPEFESTLDHLVRCYSVFSRRYFELEGKRPLIKEFHLDWIRAILKALAVGGKQLIISPPRHGKSEMLVRFAVWLIIMDPNIRIMWVAANKDVAGLMLGAVKDHLENNEPLIRSTLPPGDKYKPDRQAGKPWSTKEIKVAQQSRVGQKSSSMLALGRTAKILSRDVDLLIVDDLEDFDTTREPAQRQYSRHKFAEIGTRKEEKTAWVNIGSRQHPDDIPNSLMQLEGGQSWKTIVNSAHEDCDLDPDDIEGHDTNGCVLFPEVRSYRWLVEKRMEMDALGIPGAYEMRYLNRPIPETGIVFDVPLIREVALNKERDLGLEELPLGKLVAGLDPSARGVQASFLWHYTPEQLSMVDLETQQAGGMDGAVSIILDWYEKYGLTLWFYETNAQQVDFYDHIRKEVAKVHPEIIIKDHNTGTNKKDAELGISSMAPLYHKGFIQLPYGTRPARQKVNLLLRQLELWTTDGVQNRKALTDIKMSQWFPYAGRIVKWMKDDRAIQPVMQKHGSYPGLQSFGDSPWQTTYPG